MPNKLGHRKEPREGLLNKSHLWTKLEESKEVLASWLIRGIPKKVKCLVQHMLCIPPYDCIPQPDLCLYMARPDGCPNTL